jgi:hypothetical protein
LKLPPAGLGGEGKERLDASASASIIWWEFLVLQFGVFYMAALFVAAILDRIGGPSRR